MKCKIDGHIRCPDFDRGCACYPPTTPKEPADMCAIAPPLAAPKPLTGGSSDYYKLRVSSPTSGGDAYTTECNDIIEALGMNYAEGNAFKAIWRIAAKRLNGGKPGTTALYDSEKVVFFGQRMVEQNRG